MRPMLALAALLTVLVACIVPTQAQSVTATFVGKVANSNAFVAVVTAQGKAIAYICDGETITQWYRGKLKADGTLETTSTTEASKINARINASGVTGKIELAGRTLEFSATPATGNAGLYRSEDTFDNAKYLGGWAVLSDTEQRGAVVGGGGTRPGFRLAFGLVEGKTKITANVPGLALTPFGITPEYVVSNVE